MAAAVAQLRMAASLAGEDSLNRLLLLQLLVQQAVSGALAAGQWQVPLFPGAGACQQACAPSAARFRMVGQPHVGSALPLCKTVCPPAGSMAELVQRLGWVLDLLRVVACSCRCGRDQEALTLQLAGGSPAFAASVMSVAASSKDLQASHFAFCS